MYKYNFKQGNFWTSGPPLTITCFSNEFEDDELIGFVVKYLLLFDNEQEVLSALQCLVGSHRAGRIIRKASKEKQKVRQRKLEERDELDRARAEELSKVRADDPFNEEVSEIQEPQAQTETWRPHLEGSDWVEFN